MQELGPGKNVNLQAQKYIDWIDEMKIKLLKIDDEERSKGRGFMRGFKERWDLEFLEQASAGMHNLRNNESHFLKELRMRNLILVRARMLTFLVIDRNKKDKQQVRVDEDPSNHQIKYEAERDSVRNDRVQEANGLINGIDHEQELKTAIRVEDEELENIFNQIL